MKSPSGSFGSGEWRPLMDRRKGVKNILKLNNLMQKNVCVCLCVVTRLKGDLTEHHPHVSEEKATAEGFGRAAIERHGHVASAWVLVVQHRVENHRRRLPAGNEAGFKPTGDGGEDLHATGEHVVTVNLEGQMGSTVIDRHSNSHHNHLLINTLMC